MAGSIYTLILLFVPCLASIGCKIEEPYAGLKAIPISDSGRREMIIPADTLKPLTADIDGSPLSKPLIIERLENDSRITLRHGSRSVFLFDSISRATDTFNLTGIYGITSVKRLTKNLVMVDGFLRAGYGDEEHDTHIIGVKGDRFRYVLGLRTFSHFIMGDVEKKRGGYADEHYAVDIRVQSDGANFKLLEHGRGRGSHEHDNYTWSALENLRWDASDMIFANSMIDIRDADSDISTQCISGRMPAVILQSKVYVHVNGDWYQYDEQGNHLFSLQWS
jgi:hypothetical protein